jgi:hypothetical protein
VFPIPHSSTPSIKFHGLHPTLLPNAIKNSLHERTLTISIQKKEEKKKRKTWSMVQEGKQEYPYKIKEFKIPMFHA